ncbi:olfactory receptor 1020-like [Bombina bombina]|uniref:olfactory receptor 1020-like n=1 Tax=Bombina bombina TaxID=8345 RepID=UPI00235AD8BD|nr:olfactory receptor 1020-like [Bombina bombina]
MDVENQTRVSKFIFSGLTDSRILSRILFLVFLLVYLITIIGNIGMMTMVYTKSHLHTPMYYFLGNLSLVDLLYSSVVTPKMLSDLISESKSISIEGCAIQLFSFASMGVTEALLLADMSYDRYVAICKPLNYVSIMTGKKCVWLILLTFFIGFFQSSVQTGCIFHLDFCDSYYIDHFYCDFPPLFKLSCSETFPCHLTTTVFVYCFGGGSLMIILVSYSFIVYTILNIKSSKGRSKAFSTCSSHLTCVSFLYGTVFFIYLRPSSSDFEKQDKVVAVFYTVIIPMLNPLIYSFRNKDVQNVIKGNINKIVQK